MRRAGPPQWNVRFLKALINMNHQGVEDKGARVDWKARPKTAADFKYVCLCDYKLQCHEAHS